MPVQFTARHEGSQLSDEYSTVVHDGNRLSLAVGAALAGSGKGMSVNLNGTTTLIYAYKQLASAVTTGIVRYRFYLDPNTLTMSNGTGHSVVMITDLSGNPVSFVLLTKTAGGSYGMYAVCVQDGGTHVNSNEVTITDAPHWVEVETRRAANSTSTDGFTQFWIDDIFAAKTNLTDNFDQLNDWQLIIAGAPSGVDASTSGTYYLDELVVNDDGRAIGAYGVSMPSVIQKASTAGTSLSGGVSLNMPSGITAGDLLIAFASNDNTGGTNMGISGWTQLFHSQFSGNVISHGAWAKIAAGSDTATLTGASEDFTALVCRIVNHGVSSIGSDIMVGTAATGTSDQPDPPSLDAGSVKYWLWLVSNASDDDDETNPYAPTNYTPEAQLESAQSTSSTQLQVASRNANTQTENPGTFLLFASEEWIAQTIAIKPPPPLGGSLSQVTETDLAQAFTRSKARTLTLVTETDLAQAFTRSKAKSITLVTETDQSLALARSKNKSITLVTETDQAIAFTARKQLLISLVQETDQALVIERAGELISTVIETDQAIAFTARKQLLITLVTETDQSLAFTARKQLQLTMVQETDQAMTLIRSKQLLISLVTETDQSLAFTRSMVKSISQVTETDLALSFTSSIQQLISLVTETDQSLALARSKNKSITLVTETDLAQDLTRRKQMQLGLVQETDQAMSLMGSKQLLITLATETDQSIPFTVRKQLQLTMVQETDLAMALLVPKRIMISLVTEIDLALILTALGGLRKIVTVSATVCESVSAAAVVRDGISVISEDAP